jgi:hypothetical protein
VPIGARRRLNIPRPRQRAVYSLDPYERANIKLAHGKDKITLTDSQRKRLSGLKNAATVKELEVLPVTTETCTCELLNVAVRTNKGSIEVANDLFGRDFTKEHNDFLLARRQREEQEKAEQAKPSYILKTVEERFRKLSDRVGRQLKPVEQERR